MSSGNKRTLLECQVISSDATTVSSSLTLSRRENETLAVVTVSCHCAGDFTLTIEHSPDDTNWVTLGCAGNAVSADGIDVITLPEVHLPYIRASVLSACTTCASSNVKVELFSEHRN